MKFNNTCRTIINAYIYTPILKIRCNVLLFCMYKVGWCTIFMFLFPGCFFILLYFVVHLGQTIRNKNCPWWPYLLAEWDEMKKFCRGPYIDAFCQVWFHLTQLFQRSRLKYEKDMAAKGNSCF
jgi:hypothetical protein